MCIYSFQIPARTDLAQPTAPAKIRGATTVLLPVRNILFYFFRLEMIATRKYHDYRATCTGSRIFRSILSCNDLIFGN